MNQKEHVYGSLGYRDHPTTTAIRCVAPARRWRAMRSADSSRNRPTRPWRRISGARSYMRLLRDMAALLAASPASRRCWPCAPRAPPADYARRLLAAGNFRMLLVDTGFPTVDSLDLPELGGLAGCPAAPILRLETLMEQLIAASITFAQVEEGLREAVRTARAQGSSA